MSHPGPTLPPPPPTTPPTGRRSMRNGQLLDGQNAGQAYPGQYGSFPGQHGAEPQKTLLVTWLFRRCSWAYWAWTASTSARSARASPSC